MPTFRQTRGKRKGLSYVIAKNARVYKKGLGGKREVIARPGYNSNPKTSDRRIASPLNRTASIARPPGQYGGVARTQKGPNAGLDRAIFRTKEGEWHVYEGKPPVFVPRTRKGKPKSGRFPAPLPPLTPGVPD